MTTQIKTIAKNPDGGWYKPKTDLQPGDVVEMEGDYAYINLDGISGTADNPIVFKPKGKVRIGTNNSYSSILTNCHYILFDGITDADKYGFYSGGTKDKLSTQGFGFATSDNIEIRGVEIAFSQVGFFAAPMAGTYQNIKIHDCYIHDLDNPSEGGRAECFYIGRTSTASTTTGGNFKNVEIYNNRLENLSGDGIQIALTENVYIHDNVINGYGKANLEQQRSGIIVGGCTSGRVENNTVSNGTGSPFQCFGGGDVYFINNTATNCGTSANEDGFYMAGLCKDGPLRVHLIGNKIDKVARTLVRTEGANVSIVENTGNSWNPPAPPPPPTKTLLLTIHVYSDKTVSTAKSVNSKKTLVTNVKVYSDGSISQ